jgi:hypothetical protein
VAKKKEELEEVVTEEVQPVSLIHVDEYLATRGDEIRPEVQSGFKVFMRGRSYQTSIHAFDEELEKYFTRKI